jgi:hypothetical protein
MFHTHSHVRAGEFLQVAFQGDDCPAHAGQLGIVKHCRVLRLEYLHRLHPDSR